MWLLLHLWLVALQKRWEKAKSSCMEPSSLAPAVPSAPPHKQETVSKNTAISLQQPGYPFGPITSMVVSSWSPTCSEPAANFLRLKTGALLSCPLACTGQVAWVGAALHASSQGPDHSPWYSSPKTMYVWPHWGGLGEDPPKPIWGDAALSHQDPLPA